MEDNCLIVALAAPKFDAYPGNNDKNKKGENNQLKNNTSSSFSFSFS